MKNLQNMSGEQLLLARIFNAATPRAVTTELNRRRNVAKATKGKAKIAA